MTEDMIEIEGLSPWVESGDLGKILANYAAWVDSTGDIEAEFSIRQWDVSRIPTFHRRPKVVISLTFGPKGYRGSATLDIWRGADPEMIPSKLIEATEAARAAHEERKIHGTTYYIPAAKFVLPDEATDDYR